MKLPEYKALQDKEDFFETYFHNDPYGAIEATQNDGYNIEDKYVIIDYYNDVISYSEDEYNDLLIDNIDEIIDSLLDNLSHVYLSLFCIVLIFTNSFFFYLVAVIMPPVALAHTSIILSWSGHCLCYCTLCKN